MKSSEDVRAAFIRFCDRLSACDLSQFDCPFSVGDADGEVVALQRSWLH